MHQALKTLPLAIEKLSGIDRILEEHGLVDSTVGFGFEGEGDIEIRHFRDIGPYRLEWGVWFDADEADSATVAWLRVRDWTEGDFFITFDSDGFWVVDNELTIQEIKELVSRFGKDALSDVRAYEFISCLATWLSRLQAEVAHT